MKTSDNECFKRGEGGVSRFHDELPFAQPTQSFAEERRQDSLQVRLPAPERMTAFPDDDVSVETVGQFLVEPSPLSVHACTCEGWCHRVLGQLLHLDRFSDDSSDGGSHFARCILTRARKLDKGAKVPGVCDSLLPNRSQIVDSKDGEMSEWLKEHAWKTIVVTLAKRY